MRKLTFSILQFMNRLIDFRFKYLSTPIFFLDSFPIFLPSSSHSVLDIFNILHQENKVKSSKRLKLKSRRCYSQSFWSPPSGTEHRSWLPLRGAGSNGPRHGHGDGGQHAHGHPQLANGKEGGKTFAISQTELDSDEWQTWGQLLLHATGGGGCCWGGGSWLGRQICSYYISISPQPTPIFSQQMWKYKCIQFCITWNIHQKKIMYE